MGLILNLVRSRRRELGPLVSRYLAWIRVGCIVGGVVWLLVLPLDGYNRETYISENALLPGQVRTYFDENEQAVINAYRHEFAARAVSVERLQDEIETELASTRLKTARQQYVYREADARNRTNVYGLLQAPRGDATEAIVLAASLVCADQQGERTTSWVLILAAEQTVNAGGVALLLALARYFGRWSLWSKDIVFLVTGDPVIGYNAWTDAYHGYRNRKLAADPLQLKSGEIQAAVNLEYCGVADRFDSISIQYEGVNGRLANLDLINTAVFIAQDYFSVPVRVQNVAAFDDNYFTRLQTLLRGMVVQAIGKGAGHGVFMRYKIDAINLQINTSADGMYDDVTLGRIVESLFRSINNLLEHFHQSFFFYLLLSSKRFVSIATYLPSAMLVAAASSITAVDLWNSKVCTAFDSVSVLASIAAVSGCGYVLLQTSMVLETNIGIMLFLLAVQVGEIATVLYFRKNPGKIISESFALSCKVITLLLNGTAVSALATTNFSLGMSVGIATWPLSFVQPSRTTKSFVLKFLAMQLISPINWMHVAVIFAGGNYAVLFHFWRMSLDVWGSMIPLVWWLLWWPIWYLGCLIISAPAAAAVETPKIKAS